MLLIVVYLFTIQGAVDSSLLKDEAIVSACQNLNRWKFGKEQGRKWESIETEASKMKIGNSGLGN